MDSVTLEAKNVQKTYVQGQRNIHVLKDLSLRVEEGQSVAITGASGVGKSTFLHCLGLLDQIDAGEIYLAGKNVHELSPKDQVFARRELIGFVFQFHYLMAELTALENVMIPLRLSEKRVSKSERFKDYSAMEKEAQHWLTAVGLEERLHHRPAQLSGGEQQRVAIARALVKKPRLILADEPTGNLDPETARRVFEILKDRCRELSASLVMTTHNLDLAAQLDRQWSLRDGKLC